MSCITIKDDYIKLGQALKLSGLVGSGAESKLVIAKGLVKVNGAAVAERGKKLYAGDYFEYDGNKVEVFR